MPLTWDLTKVEWYQNASVQEKNKEWSFIEFLIFRTMNVGIRSIKDEAAAEEFWMRCVIYDKAFGFPLSEVKDGVRESRSATLDEIKRFIGLSTNANVLTKTQFAKLVIDNQRRELQYQLQQLREKQQKV